MDEKEKAMTGLEILEVIMPIESLELQVHETRTLVFHGHHKPSQGIRGHGVLYLASDFKTMQVTGTMDNTWALKTVSHAEFDEIDNILYLEFK